MRVATSPRTLLLLFALTPMLIAGMSWSHLDGLAQTRAEFTTASLEGSYAFTSIFTGRKANDSAALAVVTFDANENVTVSFIQNVPGLFCSLLNRDRCIVPGTSVGTYTVNLDGTGSANLVSQRGFRGSTMAEISFDAVVTQGEIVGTTKRATEVFLVQKGSTFPNNGKLATAWLTKLPDEGSFTTASLQGAYAITGMIGANHAAPLGVVVFDGNGSSSSSYTINLPQRRSNRRIISGITGVGSYTVNGSGTGAVTMTNTLSDGSLFSENNFDFVITRVDAIGSLNLATEVFAIQREPEVISGQLVTWVLKRQPD